MQYSFPVDVQIPRDQLSSDGKNSLLGHLLLLNHLAEIATLTELGDDVGIVLGCVNLEELDDVGALRKFSKTVYFRSQ